MKSASASDDRHEDRDPGFLRGRSHAWSLDVFNEHSSSIPLH